MKNNRINVFILLLSLFILISMISAPLVNNINVEEISYNEFLTDIQNGEVKTIVYQEKNGVYQISGEYVGDKGKSYLTSAVMDTTTIQQINEIKGDQNIEVIAKPSQNGDMWGALFNIISFGLFIAMAFWIVRMITKQGKQNFQFGNSKAQKVTNPNTKFSDVAGYLEEKQELAEIVDFLDDPIMYTKMGARIPKGILLVGPPGTGKTLLAKSIAGEAKVPFFTVSGSEFVEMYVGVGASRVRDLFKQAKKTAPAIIFIDEIDALGKKRGNGSGNSNDEKEQTLNQLLVELDGFEPNSGVVVIAATNRSEMLDDALLRPGRFDRQVTVGLPDLKTREEILKLHGKKRKVSKSINIADYAQKTSGFSGAQLENVVNEAAIVAVRHKKKEIDDEDIQEAIDRVMAGPAKKTRKYSERDKKIVSYHETGHVVVGLELDEADTVEKVTIVPRGNAGGYAMYTPKEEQFFVTKSEMLDRITALVAGRASEELFVKEISTGAHNDFERATKMARMMVTQVGMSDLGIQQYELNEDIMNPYYSSRYSEEMARKIDEQISNVLDNCYKKAKEILTKRKDDVELIANNLKVYETLTKTDIDYLLEHKEMPEKNTKVEFYTDEEIDEEIKLQIRDNYKKLQQRQTMMAKNNKEIKILTDEEIDKKVEKKFKDIKDRRLSEKSQKTVDETIEESDK